MTDFQNVKDGKPFPPLEALAPLADEIPAAKKAPKSTAAKKAAASTTTPGESAAATRGESA